MPTETVIKLKRSTSSGAAPTTSDLEVGEVAINTADGKMFTKHTNNSIVQLGGGVSAAEATNLAIIYAIALG
jgi:triosephosphate isomerase